MSEGELLLRAVLADPTDDAPRLIFADWLDEHAQSARARFIRVSIQICRTEPGRDVFSHALGPDLKNLQDVSWSGVDRDWHDGGLLITSWDRGFVSGIQCPTRTFINRAKEIFGSQPVLQVILTDQDPHLDVGMFGWQAGPDLPEAETQSGIIPFKLMYPFLLEERHDRAQQNAALFMTPELALAALSTACVSYGRHHAGLPRV